MTALLWGLVLVLERLPEAALAPIAQVVAALLYRVVRYRRKVLLENLALAFPELTPEERRALGARVMVHLCLTLLETLRLRRGVKEGWVGKVRKVGEEHLERAIDSGRGVLALTLHLGSFELVAGLLAHELKARGRARSALVVKPFGPGLDAVLGRLRENAGFELIRAGSSSAAKDILRTLRAGQIVTFVLDQNATRNQGVFVDFFGKPACTMSALAIFAARTNAVVLPVAVWREGPGAHVFEAFAPIEDAPPPDVDPVVFRTARYTRFIEERIRAHPDQWFWTHKRWRTRPSPTVPHTEKE